MPHQTTRRIGCALLVDPQGRFLLQQRDDKPNIMQPGKIGLFGGHCDSNETGLDCAVREIGEEISTSIPANRFELLVRYEGTDLEIEGGELQAELYVVRGVRSEGLIITEGTLRMTDPGEFETIKLKLTPIAVLALASYFKHGSV